MERWPLVSGHPARVGLSEGRWGAIRSPSSFPVIGCWRRGAGSGGLPAVWLPNGSCWQLKDINFRSPRRPSDADPNGCAIRCQCMCPCQRWASPRQLAYSLYAHASRLAGRPLDGEDGTRRLRRVLTSTNGCGSCSGSRLRGRRGAERPGLDAGGLLIGVATAQRQPGP